MKKSLAIILGLVSATAFANQAASTATIGNQPALAFGVYDVSNKVASLVPGNKYSVSKKDQRLCWTAFNMKFERTNAITEVFTAPKGGVFKDPVGNTVVSADGLTHTLTSSLASDNGEALQKCWVFDNSDPKGAYSVSVRVNDIQYPSQTFEVTE
ncbi:hypothetical protein A1D22_00390 [Pasteurellaceae bacterium LFhippo2]|nr:hypothetical protein [Pasteurellaceae bacterium LFhippo2]